MNNPYAQHALRCKSKEEIVLEYAPMVKHVALRLAARLPDSLQIDDLIQAGMIGLLDAIEKYDPNREAQFRTYAEFRVRGAMLDDLRAGDWIPRSVRENADRVGQAHRELRARLGRAPDEAEIAEFLGLELAEYHQLLLKSRSAPLLSLDNLSHGKEEGGASNIFEVLEDPSCTDPLERFTLQDIQERLQAAIGGLPEREQLVLSLYYDEDLNLKEIGAVMGITESRVSQLRTQAILRLRTVVGDSGSSGVLEHYFERRVLR